MLVSRQAAIVLMVAVTILLGVTSLALNYTGFSAEPVRVIVAALSLPVILTGCGASIAALQIVADVPLTWREFGRFALDCALLPVIIPTGMVLTGGVAGVAVFLVASPFYADLHAVVLAAEFAAFSVILVTPFSPYVWPVLHRAVRYCGNPSLLHVPWRIAVPPFFIPLTFAPLSLLTLFLRPTGVFCASFLSAWIVFYAIYCRVIYHFPQFVWREKVQEMPAQGTKHHDQV